MSTRGGDQRIPRPPLTRAGSPAPWARGLADAPVTLADIRRACATLPRPGHGLLRVPGVRAAAVLMPFFERGGEAVLVLTKRPDHMPTHRGEIAFPGGKLEEQDPSLAHAALREVEEEIGLPGETVDVVGELQAYGTFSSRFAIVPFVGLLASEPRYRPDPSEVEKVVEVRLGELLAEGVHREERWGIGPADRPVHFFELDGETVWGVTAGILYGFLVHLTGGGASDR